VGLTLDRELQRVTLIACGEGGVEIEEVARAHPEKIRREAIDPVVGLMPYQARKVAAAEGLDGGRLAARATSLFQSLYRAYVETDATLVEVNPLIVTQDGDLLALDAKMSFDDNALDRHPDISALRDLDEEDPRETEAKKHDLSYIALDGNIGCMVNGAGLAMATMDMIKLAGGEPANFLDVGGGASADSVADALGILLADKNVRGVLINIFGGIVRCDLVAQGVVDGAARVGINVPVVVRIEGTRAEEGRKILSEAKFKIIVADDMQDAATKAVRAAG
jgi:succinyl-CoA synthetase beta subunit